MREKLIEAAAEVVKGKTCWGACRGICGMCRDQGRTHVDIILEALRTPSAEMVEAALEHLPMWVVPERGAIRRLELGEHRKALETARANVADIFRAAIDTLREGRE